MTTTLTTAASTYTTHRRYAYFDLWSSTPTSGTATQGHGEWHVVRGGSIIKSTFNTMNFAWIGQDGDVVHARFVDVAGNVDGWVTYTFVVTGAYAHEFYVDTTGNDTTGNGSSGLPWATVGKAMTELNAVLTAGEEGVVFLKEAQTHNFAATVVAGGTTARRVHLRRWGTSGARPVLNATATASVYTSGLQGGLLIDGLNLDGNAGAAYAIQLNRSGAGTRTAWDVTVIDSDVTDFARVLDVTDNTWTAGTRSNGNWDFIAFENSDWSGQTDFHVWADNGIEKWLLRDVNIGGNGGFNNPFRIYSSGDGFIDGGSCATGDNGGMRFNTVPANGVNGASRRITFVGFTMTSNGFGEISLQADSAAVGIGYARSVRLVNCKFIDAKFSIKAAATPEMVDCDDIRLWNCYGVGINTGAPSLGAEVTQTGTLTNIELRNCAWSHPYGGGAAIASLGGDKDNWPNGSLTVTGCAGLYPTIDNPEPRYLIQAAGMTEAQLAAVVSLSDGNRLGKSDADTLNWVSHSGGTTSLATWQGTYSHDPGSGTTATTDFDWTHVGTSPNQALFNPRLDAASGPLDNDGYARAYSIDGDGFLRNASTPDAGPFEFGATATPDNPPTGGGGGGLKHSYYSPYQCNFSIVAVSADVFTPTQLPLGIANAILVTSTMSSGLTVTLPNGATVALGNQETGTLIPIRCKAATFAAGSCVALA